MVSRLIIQRQLSCFDVPVLGSANGHGNLGNSFYFEREEMVEMDEKKAKHHWQIAAIKGNENARFNLGCIEANNGNMDRAMRHFTIGAKCGEDKSLKAVKKGFTLGNVAKDDLLNGISQNLEAEVCTI
eukprot:scaffold131539_cov43-Cyclotella_meneghiniana.AAC.9